MGYDHVVAPLFQYGCEWMRNRVSNHLVSQIIVSAIEMEGSVSSI